MARYTKHLATTAAITATMILGLTAGAAGADAQSQNPRMCAPPDALAQKLGSEFGEAVTAEGVDAGGNLVQVYTSKNGTWTIAVTLPGGPSCIVSTGEGWADMEVAQAPKPAPKPDHSS